MAETVFDRVPPPRNKFLSSLFHVIMGFSAKGIGITAWWNSHCVIYQIWAIHFFGFIYFSQAFIKAIILPHHLGRVFLYEVSHLFQELGVVDGFILGMVST